MITMRACQTHGLTVVLLLIPPLPPCLPPARFPTKEFVRSLARFSVRDGWTPAQGPSLSFPFRPLHSPIQVPREPHHHVTRASRSIVCYGTYTQQQHRQLHKEGRLAVVPTGRRLPRESFASYAPTTWFTRVQSRSFASNSLLLERPSPLRQ